MRKLCRLLARLLTLPASAALVCGAPGRLVRARSVYDRVWPVDPLRDIPYPTAPMTHRDVIAIVVCMTTRGLKINDVTSDLVLFTNLLPSILRTAERGFEYWFYLGYDRGDAVLDDDITRNLIDRWFDANIALPARQDKQIDIKLVWARFENKWKKPGPVFKSVRGNQSAQRVQGWRAATSIVKPRPCRSAVLPSLLQPSPVPFARVWLRACCVPG